MILDRDVKCLAVRERLVDAHLVTAGPEVADDGSERHVVRLGAVSVVANADIDIRRLRAQQRRLYVVSSPVKASYISSKNGLIQNFAFKKLQLGERNLSKLHMKYARPV